MKKYNLYINDTIGWPISEEYVRDALKKAPEGEEFSVYVNSFGGDVATALGIRQQFADHGNVSVYIYGMTASAATILAMGAKRIYMGACSLMLVHQCSQWVDSWGQMNADEIKAELERLAKNVKMLEKVDHVIASVYAGRTGKSFEDLKDTMKAAEWMTAEEAKALGLIDEITEEDESEPLTDAALQRISAYGYPIPSTRKPSIETEDVSPSLLEKIRGIVKNLIGDKENARPKDEEQPIKPIEMNKTFTFLNALLKVEGFKAEEDGSLSVSAEQAQSVNDAIEAKDKEIAELKEQVEALSKEDGDETDEHHGGKPAEDEEGNHVEAARKAYERFKNIL